MTSVMNASKKNSVIVDNILMQMHRDEWMDHWRHIFSLINIHTWNAREEVMDLQFSCGSKF